jgi:putative transposase
VQRLAAFKAAHARARRDAMEKVTTDIAKNHGVVAMEDLRVRNMTASARGTVEEPGQRFIAHLQMPLHARPSQQNTP